MSHAATSQPTTPAEGKATVRAPQRRARVVRRLLLAGLAALAGLIARALLKPLPVTVARTLRGRAIDAAGTFELERGQLELMQLFERLVRKQGSTIVMVTDERSFAAKCSRQIVLKDGRIVEDINQRGDAA